MPKSVTLLRTLSEPVAGQQAPEGDAEQQQQGAEATASPDGAQANGETETASRATLAFPSRRSRSKETPAPSAAASAVCSGPGGGAVAGAALGGSGGLGALRLRSGNAPLKAPSFPVPSTTGASGAAQATAVSARSAAATPAAATARPPGTSRGAAAIAAAASEVVATASSARKASPTTRKSAQSAPASPATAPSISLPVLLRRSQGTSLKGDPGVSPSLLGVAGNARALADELRSELASCVDAFQEKLEMIMSGAKPSSQAPLESPSTAIRRAIRKAEMREEVPSTPRGHLSQVAASFMGLPQLPLPLPDGDSAGELQHCGHEHWSGDSGQSNGSSGEEDGEQGHPIRSQTETSDYFGVIGQPRDRESQGLKEKVPECTAPFPTLRSLQRIDFNFTDRLFKHHGLAEPDSQEQVPASEPHMPTLQSLHDLSYLVTDHIFHTHGLDEEKALGRPSPRNAACTSGSNPSSPNRSAVFPTSPSRKLCRQTSGGSTSSPKRGERPTAPASPARSVSKIGGPHAAPAQEERSSSACASPSPSKGRSPSKTRPGAAGGGCSSSSSVAASIIGAAIAAAVVEEGGETSGGAAAASPNRGRSRHGTREQSSRSGSKYRAGADEGGLPGVVGADADVLSGSDSERDGEYYESDYSPAPVRDEGTISRKSRRTRTVLSASSSVRSVSKMEVLRVQHESMLVDESTYEDQKHLVVAVPERELQHQGTFPRLALFVLRLCGALPAGLSRCARHLRNLALITPAVCFFYSLGSSTRTLYYMHFSTACFVFGGFVGSACLRLHHLEDLVGPRRRPLELYAIDYGFMDDWRRISLHRFLAAAALWFISGTFRVAAFLLATDDGAWGPMGDCPEAVATPESLVSFLLNSGVLSALMYCQLHICSGLELAIDAFCIRFFARSDLPMGVSEWNILQAMLRRSAHTIDACFLALTTSVLGLLMLTGAQVIRGRASQDGIMNRVNDTCYMVWCGWVLPPVLLVLYVVFQAAAISEKCSRVPALVNSWSFRETRPELDQHRQYVVQYIASSAAGFYVKGVRLSGAVAFKLAYLFGAVVFTFFTQAFLRG